MESRKCVYEESAWDKGLGCFEFIVCDLIGEFVMRLVVIGIGLTFVCMILAAITLPFFVLFQ